MSYTYEVAVDLNDGKMNAPPRRVKVNHPVELFKRLAIEDSDLANDYGEPFGVGVTMVITRIM